MKKRIMYETNISEKFYITEFKVGAVGILVKDGDYEEVLIAKRIFIRSEDPAKYDNEEPIWKYDYDYSVEFVTDNDRYYVGFNRMDTENKYWFGIKNTKTEEIVSNYYGIVAFKTKEKAEEYLISMKMVDPSKSYQDYINNYKVIMIGEIKND